MATHGANTRDPRSIVTPDAFEVSTALLGTPLATPSKRLAALAIDLAVIGLVTVLTKSFALVLGLVAAFFFVRAGLKRTPVKGSVFGRAMRLSVGCLGLIIGIVTAIVWVSVGIGGGGDAPSRPAREGSGAEVTLSSTSELLSVLQAIGEAREFRDAPDEAAARTAAEEVVHRAEPFDIPDRELRTLLLETVRPDAPWADRAELIVDEAIAGVGPGVTEPAPADPRLLDEFVADTLRVLEERVADVQALAEARRDRVDELQDALSEERQGGSFFAWIRDFVDELGFGFGWASLYLTVMLSWWKGQTVGKRMMGIRVVRLDGEPITWWTAFERAGGYAAGFATGLLGFAQVYWDANRQAIHDRIVGTVVVVEGAEKVLNWEEAL